MQLALVMGQCDGWSGVRRDKAVVCAEARGAGLMKAMGGVLTAPSFFEASEWRDVVFVYYSNGTSRTFPPLPATVASLFGLQHLDSLTLSSALPRNAMQRHAIEISHRPTSQLLRERLAPAFLGGITCVAIFGSSEQDQHWGSPHYSTGQATSHLVRFHWRNRLQAAVLAAHCCFTSRPKRNARVLRDAAPVA